MTQRGESGLRIGDVVKRAWWLLLVALGIRIVLALLLHPPQLAGEQAVWDRLARALAAGRGYVNPEGLPTAYHPVGYPAVISGLYLLLGAKPVVVRLAQALLSGFSVLGLGYIAGRAGGRRAMWKGLILGTIYPADLLYVTALAPATLSIALQWGLILLLRPWIEGGGVHVAKRHAWSRTLVAGALAGLAALVQPAALLLLPLLWDTAVLSRVVSRRTIWLVLVSFAVSLLLPAFWVVRNDVVIGRKTLSTQGGAAFWFGNAPFAPGGDRWYDIPAATPPFESAAEQMMIRSTLENLFADPWQVVKRLPRKWAWTLRSPSGLLARQVGGYAPGGVVDALERTPLVLRLWVWFFHVSVFAAGWSAWWFGPRGVWRRWTAALFLLSMGMATLFYGAPSMHATLVPAMLLAAVLLPERHEDFAEVTWKQGLPWMAGFLFGVGVWLVEAVQLITV